jgi:hypothetical protein
MTYKKMVQEIAGREAQKWIESFITKNGGSAHADETEIRIEDKTCYFTSKVTVYGITSPMNKYTVGGTIDENGRVYCSTVRDWHDKYVWASSPQTREAIGIVANSKLEIA